MKEKVILAYSGGLDTTALIPWLKETFDYEVICCCVNCGQGNELDGLDERAKLSGASKLYIEDITDEFCDDYIVPCVQVMTATCNLAAPGHSWQITACAGMSIGMKGMLYGAKVMAATAMKLVDDPKLVDEAKEEFKKQMNGRTYKCPVTEEIVVPAPVQ